MKRAEQKIVHEALDLIWSFIYNTDAQEDIAKQGSTQEGKMVEFMGDFPQLSNIKPEILISKAEKMRIFDALPEQIAAMKAWRDVVRGYHPKVRGLASEVLLVYREARKLVNDKTRQRYTHLDVATALKMDEATYHMQRERLMENLLMHYRALSKKQVKQAEAV